MTTRKKRYLSLLIIFLLILFVLAFFRINNYLSDSSKRPQVTPNVIVNFPKKDEIIRSIVLTGDVQAFQQAIIFSKVNGNIEKNFVDIGDKINQGSILALIDTTIYSQNVRQAYGAYMQSEANMQNLKITYERNKVLFEQKLISKQDVENSKTAYDIALAQKEASNATYKNALTQLSYCKMVAPFSGYITKRNFDVGSFVSTSGGSQGSSLFTLMNIDKVKIFANIPEKNIPLLNNIIEATVKVDAYPDKTFNASIKRVSEALDLSTRTMQIEIDVDNQDHSIKPGMFASINLILEKRKDVLTLPTNVVLDDEKGQYVFIVSEDSVANKQYVKTGIQEETKCEIQNGVTEKSRVIFVGQTLIKDKMKIRISK